jgi:hypothetical protein
MTKPEVGSSADTWGGKINADLDIVDALFTEGTWTPTDNSGAGLSLTINRAIWRRVKNLIMLQGSVTYPVTANTSNTSLAGLPVPVPANGGALAPISTGGVIYAASGGSTAVLLTTGGANIRNVDISGATFVFSIVYSAT